MVLWHTNIPITIHSLLLRHYCIPISVSSLTSGCNSIIKRVLYYACTLRHGLHCSPKTMALFYEGAIIHLHYVTIRRPTTIWQDYCDGRRINFSSLDKKNSRYTKDRDNGTVGVCLVNL